VNIQYRIPEVEKLQRSRQKDWFYFFFFYSWWIWYSELVCQREKFMFMAKIICKNISLENRL